MAISDDERREVAEELCNYMRLHNSDTFEAFYTRLNGVLFGDDGFDRPDGDVFKRLADLIDRPTTTRYGKFKTKYGSKTPCCEVCGYSIGDMRWNYCPKCGAVITND